ncbi:hypothetical protein BZL30_4365 [Mycobacterium kansasii]|uniref:Uncharacterized protein n=1 Tax=Mycobacterium kansasii TaxID=1768 RepID=A0A1V3X492_MYCKA|nr:hypothetical protein BZL29_8022 [Mycobacterium kansasii]OOK73887.1 hypothetical protein BZL30_4365 [Mycobacterium kansasii]
MVLIQSPRSAESWARQSHLSHRPLAARCAICPPRVDNTSWPAALASKSLKDGHNQQLTPEHP